MASNREIFRAISEYDNYEISNHGRVRNVNTGRINKQYINRKGYKHVSLSKEGKFKNHLVHRLVATEFIDNDDDKPCVDHIDGNRTNNHVNNLRWATITENNQNKKKRKSNTSGYKGVSLVKRNQKYRAMIQENGINKHIGYYDTAEEAHEAYKRKARELFGEFARFE